MYENSAIIVYCYLKNYYYVFGKNEIIAVIRTIAKLILMCIIINLTCFLNLLLTKIKIIDWCKIYKYIFI